MSRKPAPDEFEARLRSYLFERSEESRALRVGEKEVSEQAAIVARYADLFTREQLDALREAEEAEQGADGRERLHRLRSTCESGVLTARLAPQQDELQNAELAARVEFRGEELPLRNASARMSTLPDYDGTRGARAGRLGRLGRCSTTSAWSSPQAAESAARRALRRARPRRPERGREGGSRSASSPTRSRTSPTALVGRVRPVYVSAGSTGCSATSRAPRPSSYHAALRLPPHAARGRVHEGARDRRSASRRCATSASIWRQTRTSAPTSRTARRRRRDRASSPPTRRPSCT